MSPTTAPAPAAAPPALAEIASQLADACEQLKAWEDRRKDLLAQLEALHEAGAAPEKFKHDGLSFSRIAGKTTYSYDNAPEVITAKSALELAQEAAKAAGLATAKTGAASWRVSTPRS
jgi:HPt (histidine-containing phosphotransfer) domain-containing protein